MLPCIHWLRDSGLGLSGQPLSALLAGGVSAAREQPWKERKHEREGMEAIRRDSREPWRRGMPVWADPRADCDQVTQGHTGCSSMGEVGAPRSPL